MSSRITSIERSTHGWKIDGQLFDGAVIATTAVEAARLVKDIAPAWADVAGSLAYEPIVTVYARSPGALLPAKMLMLPSNERDAPAQFVFDLGQLGGPPGLLAFVISGARPWIDYGIDVTERLTLAQGQALLAAHLKGPLQAVCTLTEKRATFRCVPNLRRPPGLIAPGLHAAGDYIAGPYPATLEGAVNSGVMAARSVWTSA